MRVCVKDGRGEKEREGEGVAEGEVERLRVGLRERVGEREMEGECVWVALVHVVTVKAKEDGMAVMVLLRDELLERPTGDRVEFVERVRVGLGEEEVEGLEETLGDGVQVEDRQRLGETVGEGKLLVLGLRERLELPLRLSVETREVVR